MRRAAIAAVVGVLVAAAAVQARQAGRSVVHGVRVAVTVTESGRPAAGLTADDFELLDEGVPQPVESAAAAGHVAVAIAIDASLSVRERDFQRTLAAVNVLIGLLEPGDSATIVAFSDRAVPLAPLTHDQATLKRVLDAVPRRGTGPASVSVVWDAAMAAASLVATVDAPPLVVLFSDGMDNASWVAKAIWRRRWRGLASASTG